MKQIITFFTLFSLLIVNGQSWNQLGLDIDGEATGDVFGQSVSMNSSGDRLAIGTSYNDGNGNDAGHVRIYEWDGAAWVQLGLDIDGETSYDESGNSVSMNAAGDRVAIGATMNDGNGNESGHVRIYEWSGTAWVKLGLDIDGEAAGDWSGQSVSMNSSGDRLAIGAPFNDGNPGSGHVRIYEWSGTAWVKLGLDIDGESADDHFGYSVSMNALGDRVAIGSTGGFLSNFPNSGHAMIYQWSGTAWEQLGFDINGEAHNDKFGYSVSMNANGNRVAIGAKNNDGNGSNSGHVRIYEWTSTSWVQLGLDIDGEAAFDQFGNSVSMNASGDRVSIGSYNNSPSGNVRIYEWSGTGWVQLGVDIDGEATYDQSGKSVSMNASGDRVAIGAPYNDGNGTDAGHVRVYELDNTYNTGVKNISNTIEIYPNPTNDIVMIDFSNYGAVSNYSISITNSLSQQVYSSLINTTQFQIPVSTLGSVGTYFIQILDGNNSVVETKQLILH